MKVYLDIIREGRGLIVFEEADRGGSVVRDEGQWQAENEAGVVVGDLADTPEAAVQVLAKHYGITGALDIETDIEEGA
jgi:hypothetical protein